MRYLAAIIILALLFLSPARAQDALQPSGDQGYELVTILSPLPDSALSPDDPLEISLLLTGLADSRLSLFLDGTDISAQAEISGDYVYYLSPLPPSPGTHSIELTAVSNGDTLLIKSWDFIAPLSPELQMEPKLPLELNAGLGWTYSDCNVDTAGLALSTPAGRFFSAELSFSGQLLQGYVTGFASYDPSYDRDPHGLFQYLGPAWDISLGEFYPELNELAFSGLSPLGALVSYKHRYFKTDFIGCRSQPADTGYKTFAQYIYGARVGLELYDSLAVTGGYFQGHDQPGSLPDSVRYATSYYVFTDSLLGITDTLKSADTLHPGRNRVSLFSVLCPLGGLVLDAEYVHTAFYPDTGSILTDQAYSARAKYRQGSSSLSVKYSSVGRDFSSFGNPYAEAAKNELELRPELSGNNGWTVSSYASAYKVFTDSSDGNSYKAGVSFNLSGPGFARWLASLYLSADYNTRPYTDYKYQCRSSSLNFSAKAGRFRISPSYSYSASQSDRLTQSHTAGVNLDYGTAGDRWQAGVGYQYYEMQDDLNSSNQRKHTVQAKGTVAISPKVSLDLGARLIKKGDRVDPAQSYRQTIGWGLLNYRF